MKYYSKFKSFHSRKCTWKCRLSKWLPSCPRLIVLTHWGRVTHICINKLAIIGSDNGLSPGRRQTIIWTNAGILLIKPLGTNVNEMLIAILTFSFMKMHLKVSSGKCRPFCLGLDVLKLVLRLGLICDEPWVITCNNGVKNALKICVNFSGKTELEIQREREEKKKILIRKVRMNCGSYFE